MLGLFLQQIYPEEGLNYYGGDLNFSLGAIEVWGPRARVDPQSRYFVHKLVMSGSMDINLVNIKTSWRNKRAGED